MESGTEAGLDQELHIVAITPYDTFVKWVDQPDDHGRGDELRKESCTLGNTAGNNRWHRCRKREQEKELHQIQSALGRQHRG